MKIFTQASKWQKAAFASVAIFYLYNIGIDITALTAGNEVVRAIIESNKLLASAIAVLCTPLTLFFLSRASNNIATRNVLTIGAAVFFIKHLIGQACLFHSSSQHSTKAIIYLLTYLVGAITTLYILGVITRNNTLDKKATRAINTFFVVTYIVSPIINILCVYCNIEPWHSLATATFMFTLWCIFIGSNIFDKEKEPTPALPGAYRFWNKYMKIWFILFLIATIAITITLVYASTLLANSAPLD